MDPIFTPDTVISAHKKQNNLAGDDVCKCLRMFVAAVGEPGACDQDAVSGVADKTDAMQGANRT